MLLLELRNSKSPLASRLHKEACSTFQSYQHIQRSLIQQVLEEIYSQYLSHLQKRTTDQVLADINLLILSFFLLYEKIIPQQLNTKNGCWEHRVSTRRADRCDIFGRWGTPRVFRTPCETFHYPADRWHRISDCIKTQNIQIRYLEVVKQSCR